MILADSQIKARLNSWDLIVVSTWDYNVLEQVWPASLDFRLWNTTALKLR